MFRQLFKAALPVLQREAFLSAESVLQQQLRTTFVLKRKFPTLHHKKGGARKTLRSRHYVYQLVQHVASSKPAPIDVILTTFVDGLGNIGDKVSVKPEKAYNELLIPGLAVYATPENLQRYEEFETKSEVVQYSSKSAYTVMQMLSRMRLSVVMNKDEPWTLQPWHVRVSFRKSGYEVPEDAIKIPDRPIKGPDMGIEGKAFYVTVTINNKEKVNVLCRIHHWSTQVIHRLAHEDNFFLYPWEPLFPEDKEVLDKIPACIQQKENEAKRQAEAELQ